LGRSKKERGGGPAEKLEAKPFSSFKRNRRNETGRNLGADALSPNRNGKGGTGQGVTYLNFFPVTSEKGERETRRERFTDSRDIYASWFEKGKEEGLQREET